MSLALNTTNDQEEEAKFQHYKSARIAMRMLTDSGKKIIFTGYEFLTQDPELIEYLDKQISLSRTIGIIKGELITMSERNPMETMKRKIIAEHEAKKAEAAKNKSLGITQDMGSTGAGRKLNINPASSGQTAN